MKQDKDSTGKGKKGKNKEKQTAHFGSGGANRKGSTSPSKLQTKSQKNVKGLKGKPPVASPVMGGSSNPSKGLQKGANKKKNNIKVKKGRGEDLAEDFDALEGEVGEEAYISELEDFDEEAILSDGADSSDGLEEDEDSGEGSEGSDEKGVHSNRGEEQAKRAKSGSLSKSESKGEGKKDSGRGLSEGGTSGRVSSKNRARGGLEGDEGSEVSDSEEGDGSSAREDIVLMDAEGRQYCKITDCDQFSTTEGYCRYHYLLLWKKIQTRRKILADGKLVRYVEELTSRYPDKFLEMIWKDLRSDKDFLNAIAELEIDESSLDNDYEDETQSYIDEVRGVSEGASVNSEEEEF